MEFPHLGTNCALTTCKQLDFLPLKCDACSKLFCKEHIKYTEHSCENSYKKDHQVPVCPLCNKPVPVPRGQQPDIKVGEHIDRDCQSDPALAKRKAYLNRCSLKGCKQKECVDEICKCDHCKLLSSTDNGHVVSCGAGCYSCNAESVDEKSVDETLIPVRCDSCRQNFCLKHRHEQDHNCSAVVRGSGTGGKTSASVKAGEAATTRAMKSSSSKVNQTKPQMTALSSIGRDLDRSRRERQQQTRAPQSTGIPRPALSEDEALALAIQASLQDQTKTQSTSSPQTTQEEEDRALAQALAESEREEQNRRRQQQRQQEKKSDCCVT